MDPESFPASTTCEANSCLRQGHTAEGKKELDTSVRMSRAKRDQRQKDLEGGAGSPVPN